MSMKMTVQVQINMIMQAIFARYDSDNNGYLDKNQVKQLLKDAFCDNSNKGKEMVNKFYQRVDVNGDGKISKNQIEVLIKQILQLGMEKKSS